MIVASLDGSPEHDAEVSEEANGNHHGAVVLVVEDEEIVRRLLVVVLSSAGYRALEAGDGREALAILDEEEVDLVVTDLVLPGMGGLEMADRLARAAQDIPILVMSGYSTASFEQDETRAKQLPYLRKPFTPDELLQKVRALLD